MICGPCQAGDHMTCLVSLPDPDPAVGYAGETACACEPCEAMQDAADDQADDGPVACETCGDPTCDGVCAEAAEPMPEDQWPWPDPDDARGDE